LFLRFNLVLIDENGEFDSSAETGGLELVPKLVLDREALIFDLLRYRDLDLDDDLVVWRQGADLDFFGQIQGVVTGAEDEIGVIWPFHHAIVDECVLLQNGLSRAHLVFVLVVQLLQFEADHVLDLRG